MICSHVPRSKNGSGGGEPAPWIVCLYMRRGSRHLAGSSVPNFATRALNAVAAALR